MTCSGRLPNVGLMLRLAVGARSFTVSVAVVVDDLPTVSVTVTLTVYVPALVYV